MWGLLPPIARDQPPPGVDSLGVSLCFIDLGALYRLLAWVDHEQLVMRVERTPFSTPMRVSVADNQEAGQRSRSWQFLDEEQNFNLHGAEGPYATAFLHELARRFGWPLSPGPEDSQ
jgi:hypothetical protein